MDRSWTIYHMFTGIPARVDGSALTDLSRLAATDSMLSLNVRNVRRPKEWNTRSRLASKPSGQPVNHPNPSRSFDEARNAVLFFGRDGVFEIRFFVEAGALAMSAAALAGMSEAKCLSVFDAVRTSIQEVADFSRTSELLPSHRCRFR
jgi:hypothetical protein